MSPESWSAEVWVLQVGGGLDLAQEPFGADHGGEFGAEDLYRDVAVVFEITREIDRGHAALPELALDGVAVCEGSGESGGKLAHEPPFASSFAAQFRTSTASFVDAVCLTMKRWPSGLTSYGVPISKKRGRVQPGT